jgi:hypothetical protein
MLAEILHALIDAAGPELTDNRRGELHAMADDAETEFLRKAALIQAELSPEPANVPAGA